MASKTQKRRIKRQSTNDYHDTDLNTSNVTVNLAACSIGGTVNGEN